MEHFNLYRSRAMLFRCRLEIKELSVPVEAALLVDFSEVHSQALLIAGHGDLKHPSSGVETLRGTLHSRYCLVIGYQVAGPLTQMPCSSSMAKVPILPRSRFYARCLEMHVSQAVSV